MSGYNRPPPDWESMVSLKVDNLSYRTRPDDLERLFSKYGEVGDVYIPRDRFTKESRGFAFVRFFKKRDAEDAMDDLHGAIFEDRELKVQKAKYGRPSRPPPHRGGYGDRRGYHDDRSSGRYSSSSYSRRRSRSRSPRRHRRRSHSRSRSRSPDKRSRSHSKSGSRSNSRSPKRPSRRSHSRSKSHTPDKKRSPSAKSKSRSRSPSRSP